MAEPIRTYVVQIGDGEYDPTVKIKVVSNSRREWSRVSDELAKAWPDLLDASADDFDDPPRRVRQWLIDKGLEIQNDESDGIVLTYQQGYEELIDSKED
jgi:hypothetical protein